jgi:NAD+ kinase
MSSERVIRHLGLCGNPHKGDLQPAVSTLLDICRERGVRVSVCRELAAALDDSGHAVADVEEHVVSADIVVAMGGDGTMLRAARSIGDRGTPLLGINLGSLGYLTDIPVDAMPTALARVLDGDYILVGRSRVQCTLWRDHVIAATAAGLNDVVVNMGPLPRTLDLELRVGGTSLGRFLGDGVIFATATGSTAYSLSAGGTICQPDLPGLLVTPICPHSLGVRPLILNDRLDIELVLHETGEGGTLTADGQVATPLQNEDRLSCRLTPPTVRLVKFHDSDFFEVLRHKLHWGVTPRLRAGSRRYHPGCEPGRGDT